MCAPRPAAPDAPAPPPPQIVKLKAFSQFENTTEALAAATAIVDSKLSKNLKKFLKKHAEGDSLAVIDAKLGSLVKEKLGIPCIHGNGVLELVRGVRTQLQGLVAGLAGHDLTPMALGLSHSLSRYKLKFSPDKVDTMIVQAIGLLDDLDKEVRGGSRVCTGCCLRVWGGLNGCMLDRCMHGRVAACECGAVEWAYVGQRTSVLGILSAQHTVCTASTHLPTPCSARSSTRTPCACGSGTAGTTPRWARSCPTTSSTPAS